VVATVKAPSTGGKANRDLVALIASDFGCAKASVMIQSGMTAKIETVEVRGRQ
jgi:uncharacterized protein YggU (UPF0235/DUF167 family)